MLVGNSVFAPFNDSEQIGSHARPPELMSKPVSPNNVNALPTLQGVHEIVVAPRANSRFDLTPF